MCGVVEIMTIFDITWVWKLSKSSAKGHLVDALALRGDEGRERLRKVTGRRQYPLIRKSPNEGTHHTCGIPT